MKNTSKPENRVAAVCLIALAGMLSSGRHVQGQNAPQVGYAVLTSDAGTPVPVSAELLSYTNSGGVLLSQAAVGSVEPIRSGRIFVDEVGTTRTAIAVANPSSQDAVGTWILRDDSGAQAGNPVPLALGARQHLAVYVSQLFSNRPANFRGSLTFESNQPLAAVTLRDGKNAQGESLYTTMPVVDLGSLPGSQPVVFPQIAAGDGYSTQLILINSGSVTLSGRVRFVAPDGQPLLLRLQGSTVSDFAYQISGDAIYRPDLDSVSGLAVGYAVVVPDAGSRAPSGIVTYQFKSGNQLITETSVAATPATTAARIFVDYAGASTGLAIANPGDLAVDLTFTLMDRNGVTQGTAFTSSLPARNHIAKFVREFFTDVPDGYTGLMEIQSSNPIVPVTLKLTSNTRGNMILTTLPVADLDHPPSATSVVFPRIALADGFSTRLILLNADRSNPGAGRMTFYAADGTPMLLPMAGQTASQFGYQVVQGGGRQFLPGNSAAVAQVALLDPRSNKHTPELVINEGSAVWPRLLILDSTGLRRDDFDASITSKDQDVAAVDMQGRVQGKKAGFSTLTINVGGMVLPATATVVRVDSGRAGYGTPQVKPDPAGRLYLASTTAHTILLAQDLKQTPEVYAGVTQTPGLKNTLRHQSLFNNPSFLELSSAEHLLYVSDASNHVIRTVPLEPAGTVETGKVATWAGTGTAGSSDGPTTAASFNNPQGIAVDNRGRLWIADSGNHTIRRIDIGTHVVETVAGKAGAYGSTDGLGTEARFHSPAGIAVESETLTQQAARRLTGAPPPPITVIVADTGNGLIRRVKETGEVETIGTVQPASAVNALHGIPTVPLSATFTPARFASPAAVAVDAAGNIYVTEPAAGDVKTILKTGDVVSAAQAGTFVTPAGIAIAQNGKVLVAGSGEGVRELTYGEPEITDINPNRIGNKGGQRITITGKNFAPDTVVVVAGAVISTPVIADTQTITFIAPALPSGRTALTVQNRGGLKQKSFLVDPVPLSQTPAGYMTTVAGGSTFAGEGNSASMVSIDPVGIALDGNGNIFIAERENRRVRRVDARTGIMTTVAGGGQPNRFQENVPAVAVDVYPSAIAFDPSGNLLILSNQSPRGVHRVAANSGIITTIVRGDYGSCGEVMDPAQKVCLVNANGLAVDTDGNLFIADSGNQRILRMDRQKNIVTTIAGTGEQGFSGNNVDAKSALLNYPSAVAIDNVRKLLYIADEGNNVVRKIDIATNIITTVAGGGSASNDFGDNGPATSAVLSAPAGLVVDTAGNLLISDRGYAHDRIRKVDISTRIITSVVTSLKNPLGMAVDAGGNIFLAEEQAFAVRKFDLTHQILSTVAGNNQPWLVEENVPATAATLRNPIGISVDPEGNLFITDAGTERIRKVDAGTGFIHTIAGGGQPPDGVGDNGPATNARLAGSGYTLGFDRDGNIYIAERWHYRVRKIDKATGTITTVAGNDQNESSGDGGLAIHAGVIPNGVALDRLGNLYIAENDVGRVRRVNLSTGFITTVAGGGIGPPGGGDNGPATRAVLGSEFRIAADAFGNLFIADTDNARVRRVDAATQEITTVAGGRSTPIKDNVPATSVRLLPIAVAVDAAGNLFILDWGYPTGIRKVAADTRLITTVAGVDKTELGDNGPAIDATMYYPYGITVDSQGNVFIADTSNQRIRAIRGPIP